MSFIFEALKRAEEDRQRGKVPPLVAILRGGPGPRRRRWPWLVVAGLAANAVVLGGWLWTRQPSPSAEETTAPVEKAEPAETVTEVERPARPPRISSEAFVRQSGSPARVSPGGERTDESYVRPSPGAQPEPVRPDRKYTVQAPTASVPSGTPDTTPARGGLEPERSPSVEPVRSVGRPDPVPLEALPAGVRTRLDRIRVDGHVYRDDPAKSFVFIDNHVYHVGDTVGPDGPRIETITPTGLVVDYGGGRAILTVSGGEP